MPRLYHFSGTPSIKRFEPRLVPGRPDVMVPAVWAIEDAHEFMYLFPRDCPRALLWPVETTTTEDREYWLAHSNARVVAFIEYAWLDRLRETRLYRYALPAETFTRLEDAGMWVSLEAVTPLAVESIEAPIEALRDARVELRVVERLTPLRGVWERTTMHWSGIRLRNAVGWELPSSPAPDRLRG